MIKIKEIQISGIRGIKENLNITLDSSKSILIYGDNGSGKSSITDAIEWFYYDRVEHLSSKEIGRKGIDALRNVSLTKDKAVYAELRFSDSRFDSCKKLFYKRSKLTSEYSNSAEEFSDYIDTSLKENLILRYKDLLKFILFTKTEKLEKISQIIGFSEVTKVKNVFKKAVNSLKKELKIRNVDSQINNKQAQILEQIGQNINNDEQYFSAVRELVAPLKLPAEVKDSQSIDAILKLIKKPEDKEALSQQLSYEKVIGVMNTLKNFVENMRSSYEKYYEQYQAISRDIEKFKKISLEKLLSEGLLLLEKGIFEDEKCPLCLQEKNREELIEELRERIEELAAFKKEKEALEDEGRTIHRLIQNSLSEIEAALRERCLLKEDNLEIKSEIEQLKESLSGALSRFRKLTFMEREKTIKPEEFILLDNTIVQKIASTLKDKMRRISTDRKDDLKFTINSKLILVKQAYTEIKSFKRELEIFKQQLQSMELIYDEFVKRQKTALFSFLTAISSDMNELYLYMNRTEEVDEITLIPVGDGDELTGITIEFKFHGSITKPPDKYLSESHLNCLGICFFLSSVKAFNHSNKFFILDDVISSFDTAHRTRFAGLLMEKFSDYQILLFTHEKNWFEYLTNTVKGRNWVITQIVWNYENGAQLEIPLFDLKQRIDNKFGKSDASDLGNMIRKYLEGLLKEICLNLEVKVKFLYNDQNENRMSNELVSELRSKLKSRKCELKDNVVLERLHNSIFLGNKASHDGPYPEDINDLKTFYDYILELEGLFRCISKCKRLISKKYYDSVRKVITCKCGSKKYNWER